MSATDFLIGSYFRRLLLVPALLRLAGLACHVHEGTASRMAESRAAET